MNVKDFIRSISDFPKPGVQFRDITPLLSNPKASEACVTKLIEMLEGQQIDKVAAVESRGFFFGILLAQRLGVGFVPIRKPGKLPYEVLSETYDLEYGTDALEIHKDAISKGERILLHDDVLATGGTALAASRLIERLEGKLIQCNFLIEIEMLNGRQKLEHYPVKSLMTF